MRIFSPTYINYLIKKNLRKGSPRWLVLAIDLYVTLNTFLLTFLVLRMLRLAPAVEIRKVIIYQLPQILIIALISFLAVGSYKRIIRYTGFRDVINVFKANLLILVLMSIIYFSYYMVPLKVNHPVIIGRGVIIFHFFFNTMVLVFLRLFYKGFYEKYVVEARTKKRALIYGAGQSGIITRRALEDDNRSETAVFGFVDDDSVKIGKKIDGIAIYNPSDITDEFLEKNEISEIIISIQKIGNTRLNQIVDRFTGLPIKLRIVPPVKRWIRGDLTSGQIKPVNIEDLLGREPIELEKQEILEETEGKVVLVTGAAGSIGGEISRQLMNYPLKKLILLDQAESPLFFLQQMTKEIRNEHCEFVMGNVRNEKRMGEILKHYQPDIIYHAAAYKHVPLMEENPYEAVMTNVKGTKVMADLAIQYGVKKFVMISTDKAVNPTNVMGASKRVAELYVTSLNHEETTRFIVTRFGNVLGSNGSVIPVFKRQIEKGGPLTVTHPDITRYFMTIPEACQLVLEAGAMGKGGEVFVFDMGESVKIFDMAKKLIYLSGLKYPEDIDIKIIGLRPGEKIYEELLADNEITLKTHHPKIMVAKVKEGSDEFCRKLEELIHPDTQKMNHEELNMWLVKKIKKMVPEYKSNNSVFATLDEPEEE